MNRKILGLLGVAMVAAPIAATAQTTTLEYQGDVITGISTYLPNGFTGGEYAPLPTSPFVGSFSASITVDGSVRANDLNITAANFVFGGSNFVSGNGATFSLEMAQSPQSIASAQGAPNFCVLEGCVDLTISHGAITGATVDINSLIYNASDYLYGIGPHGDFIDYAYGNEGGCPNFPPPSGTYTGPTISPCSLGGSNTRAGTWIVSRVPEIDPSLTMSGVMLLIGGLAVLRGRRA
jgi:hypothetical protein